MAASTFRNSRLPWLLVLVAIGFIALALRWYYVSTALVLRPIRGDATQYFTYAWNLVHHGVFAKGSPGTAILVPDNYRDPGYPFFLAIWMNLLGTGGSWYAAVLLCQAALGAWTVVLTTSLGRCWLPAPWAIAAGLLLAVWPHNITINGYLLTETLFGFLCILGLLLATRAFEAESPWRAAVAGVVLGAAALTNAVLLPFGMLLSGVIAWRKLASPKVCTALLIGSFVLPGAWAVRNLQIPPPPTASTSKGRAVQNLVQGAWPEFHAAYRDSVFGDAATREQARRTLRAVREEAATAQASLAEGIAAITHRFSQHPIRYARWYLIDKPHELWGWSIVIGQGDVYVYPTRNSPFQTNPAWIALASICKAMNLLLLLLALASLFIIWRRKNRHASSMPFGQSAATSTACLIVFVTCIYTALQAEPRYAVPFRPFEILLAATTLYACVEGWRRQKHSADNTKVTDHSPADAV